MCGITGFVHADARRPADQATLQRMMGTLRHRGPDGEGSFAKGPAALGMRRLAIIDVEHGDQPLYNHDGTIAVIQNGEIYNYKELRKELQALGYEFQTQSDTEVLVHGYVEWGDAVVQHLNGMWAFAIWDEKRQRLLLSRDRLGIKPLHYLWNGETLVFGSEIKTISEWGWPTKPNWEVLDAYVAFGFVPEPYSFFKGVLKLPAGCNLIFEGGSLKITRYWELPTVDEAETRRDTSHIVEEFIALFEDSVRLQMRSDVPLGAFLSGGLDSSSIVAMAAQQTTQSVRTFTMGFNESAYDERPLARLVADRFQTQHLERVADPADVKDHIRTLQHHFDEPFGDAAALPMYVVSGIASKHVRVALSGDGGDELLAGYTRYQGEKFSHSYARLPRLLRSQMLPRGVDLAHNLVGSSLRYKIARVRRVLHAANASFESRLTSKQSWSTEKLRTELLRVDGLAVRPAREFIDEALQDCPTTDAFHRLHWFDIKMMLPGQMLTKVDRMSMAQSLEVRVPFLDHRLIELMVPVSMHVQMKGYERKHVLRRAMRERLPSELFKAGKKGFNVPMKEWFLNATMCAELRDSMRGMDDIVSLPRLDMMLDEHAAKRADHGAQFWILQQLGDWCEKAGVVSS